MVVSVDVKFVIKSTNEHPYHRAVYSYSMADWDGLREYPRDRYATPENMKLFCDSRNHCKRVQLC